MCCCGAALPAGCISGLGAVVPTPPTLPKPARGLPPAVVVEGEPPLPQSPPRGVPPLWGSCDCPTAPRTGDPRPRAARLGSAPKTQRGRARCCDGARACRARQPPGRGYQGGEPHTVDSPPRGVLPWRRHCICPPKRGPTRPSGGTAATVEGRPPWVQAGSASEGPKYCWKQQGCSLCPNRLGVWQRRNIYGF